MLSKCFRILSVLAAISPAAFGQIDKARGELLEKFEDSYKSFYEQASNQRRDQAVEDFEKMLQAFIVMYQSTCGFPDRLKSDGLEKLSSETLNWCSQAGRFQAQSSR